MTKPNGLSIFRLAVLLLLFLPLRLYHIDAPLIEMHNVRQTQTAMITRNLVKDHFNLFLTRIDWKGSEPGYFVQEFPLYSGIVAVFWKLFGAQDFWGRLVSLFFGAVAAWYLYRITATLFSQVVAFWSAVFFAVCPISVFMSQAFMINMLALALALGATFYLMLWSDKWKSRDLIVGSVMLTLSALTNNTVTFIFLFPLAYLFWIRRQKSAAFVFGLALMAALFLTLNFAWYLHAASVNALYYPENNGAKLLSHFLSVTRFSRFDPYYYFRMAMYFGYFVLGLPALVLLIWGARVLWKTKRAPGSMFVLWGIV
jgi:4-amino-4-deoxy-L-arabinose transferase-like glycosyltransferase